MTVKLPPGTPLRETDALVRALQRQARRRPDIEAMYGVSGTGTRLDANPTESGENIAQAQRRARRSTATSETEAAVTERMRATMAQLPGHRGEVRAVRSCSRFSTPLEIELRGYDLDALQRAGRKLAALMQANPHFADVKSTVEQATRKCRSASTRSAPRRWA